MLFFVYFNKKKIGIIWNGCGKKKFQRNLTTFTYRAKVKIFFKTQIFTDVVPSGNGIHSIFFVFISMFFFLITLTTVFRWLRVTSNSLFTRPFAYHLPNVGKDIPGLTTRRWLGLESDPILQPNLLTMLTFGFFAIVLGLLFSIAEQYFFFKELIAAFERIRFWMKPSRLFIPMTDAEASVTSLIWRSTAWVWHGIGGMKSYSKLLVWIIFEIVSQKSCFVKIDSW